MFRIRRIYDDVMPANREAIRQVQEMLVAHFPAVRPEEVTQLVERLRNPFKHRFRTIIYVAENAAGRVLGFALLMHDPQVGFCYLDFLAAAKGLTGRGIGGALYQRVREGAYALGVQGLFFECLPDDPRQCDELMLKHNVARLKFYEQYGARPIDNIAYQEPIKPGDTCMPMLVFDDLDSNVPPSRDYVRNVVRAILEGKYGYLCPPEYVDRVVQSIVDDPVRLRPPRYVRKPLPHVVLSQRHRRAIALVVNDRHDIHHIRERGYVESPVRIKSILAEIVPTGMFERMAPRIYSERHIKAVHAADFVDYLRKACAEVPPGKSVYPYVFPIRNPARRPKELSVRAGYYCIDTFTPLNANAFLAAKGAVDCCLTAAAEILHGRRLAYGLVRPPGHHAERRVFGGFCYFNNAAVAAQFLCAYGKVAILDIDYHHGNGQQDIFYERADVLTVSIHGHPNFAYPYFTGFADERGVGAGQGFNLNLPLPEHITAAQYREALHKALRAIANFTPAYLIVCLGLDPARGDPTGTWLLTGKDFEENGRMIAALGLPTLVIQEGGYRTRTLGANARHFFTGLVEGK